MIQAIIRAEYSPRPLDTTVCSVEPSARALVQTSCLRTPRPGESALRDQPSTWQKVRTSLKRAGLTGRLPQALPPQPRRPA